MCPARTKRSGEATTLVLIRHGHTASNGGAHARLSGASDEPLSELGRRQAVMLAQHLARQPEPFVGILSSPLSRALATAEQLVQAKLGNVEVMESLAEIHCGDYDGALLTLVQERIPEQWAANLRQDDPDFRWPGGESYREFRARCLAGVGSIARRFPGARVAVVTHAGVISQLFGHVAQQSAARWETYRPGNASLSELSWNERAIRVVRFDDRSHLT